MKIKKKIKKYLGIVKVEIQFYVFVIRVVHGERFV